MPGYRFYPPADEAQDEIWQYTVRQWGQAQAEKYLKDLHSHLAQLASKEKQWCPLPKALVNPGEVDIPVYFSAFEKHVVFFRELSNGDIGVMALLHEKMNLPVRLAEDLKKIQSRMLE